MMFVTLVLSTALSWAGSVDIFQNQPIIPDGKTIHVVQFRVPNLSQGDSVRIQSLGAVIDKQVVDDDGLLTLHIQGRTIQTKENLPIRIVVKDKSIDETVELEMASIESSRVDIRFDPPRLMPEERNTVVKIHIDDDDYHLPKLQVSHGTLSELNVAGDGFWTALYTVPDDLNHPQAVLFSVMDLANPDTLVAAATLPVARETTIEVSGLKGTVVRAEIRGQELGDAAIINGKAELTAVLYPDETYAKATLINKKGKSKSARINFENNAEPITDILAPLPLQSVPKGQTIDWWVIATDAQGKFIRKAERSFLELDSKQDLKSIRPGFFKGQVDLPSVGDSATLIANVDGVKDTQSLVLIPNLPQITTTMDPKNLTTNEELQWSLLAKDGSGALYTELLMDAFTSVGKWKDDFVVTEEGIYQRELQIPKETDSLFAYAAPMELQSSLPAARVHLLPSISSVPVSYKDGVPIFVVVEDAMGLPKSNIRVDLKVPIGDGLVPATVQTDGSGTAMFMYRSGPSAGPIMISARSGSMKSAIRLDQVAADRSVKRDVVLGTEQNRDARARWRAALPMIYIDDNLDAQSQIERLTLIEQGKTPVVQAVAIVPVAVPVPAPVSNTNNSNELIGKPAAPVQQPVIAQPAVSAPLDRPIPVDAPVVVNEEASSAQPPATSAADEPESSKPKKEPREKKSKLTSSSSPMSGYRARLEGGYGPYSFSQTATANSGEFPADVAFSSGIVALGGSGEAVFLNDRIGVSTSFLYSPYNANIGSSSSSEALLNGEGLLRYRHGLSERLVLEGGVGYHRGRGIIFRYDETKSTADINRLKVGGLYFSTGAATSLGPLDIRLSIGQVFILAPAQTKANLIAEIPVMDLGPGKLLVSLNGGVDWRYFTIEDSGDEIKISDFSNSLRLGLGFMY